ncbi:MFS general substrate transporter [Piedraia hortae CBS 480.64]|uniref:MFS general substrate transporter n=1 Tax=Piedraia hortae CBS 480.64 TaxID=1314780 RepID=A0A6A7C5F9_9PEZI|nr:MFS general substrate transporter [Piedraia hortae CBS 480.64]
MTEKDLESQRSTRIPLWKQVFDVEGITPEVQNHKYPGSGTQEDPYVVNWIPNDPRNPMLYSNKTKWFLTALVAMATLAVAFVSSAYGGGGVGIITDFHVSQIVFTLGLTFFVLGFAVGPLLWAPLSELFGRQILYVITYGVMTAFNAGVAGSPNIAGLVVMRFFAGAIGSSPLTNSGGVIADMFAAKQRGLATALFAAAPFMGPVLGPVVGGFVGQTVGWRWVMGVMAIFTGVFWIIGSLLIPETYAPVILRRRASKLSKLTGKVYISQAEADQGKLSFGYVFKTSLLRPWILLFREPIVFLFSLYAAVIYGTLYMMFAAFPIVYQKQRHWTAGIGGLAFMGVAVGMVIALAYCIWDNVRYSKISDQHKGFAPPEARLPMTMIGGIAIPIGLFWFAWTNGRSVHWMVSIAAGVPFGFGMVLVFLGIMNYLIDAYTIFAASVLAANAVMRSVFGAVFPLFTTDMYKNLGIHWASSIPAFLALACVPFPFLFYKYGATIRAKCKYSQQSEAFLRKLQTQAQQANPDASPEEFGDEEPSEKAKEEEEEERDPDEQYENGRFERIKTNQSRRRAGSRGPVTYDANPFDLDRVNTRESFPNERRSTSTRRPSFSSARSTRRD